jgi:GNAT superfamily N-acetyltransferase
MPKSFVSHSWYLEQKWKRYRLLIGEFPEYLCLALLMIPKKEQRKGIGTRVVQDVCAHADHWGKSLVVQPSDCYGSDLDRLKGFYGRFGFVTRLSCPKEMIREPKGVYYGQAYHRTNRRTPCTVPLPS